MKFAIRWWTGHGTKILGAIGTAIPGLIAIEGLISQPNVKYWLAADLLIGVFTFGRGFTNTRNQQETPQ
jgi:hypothetical protein